jgi:hypothetical protein
MVNEPERPIEKLLRAAATKRRDEAGPPFELHPTDRRLLQGEVARTLGKAQQERQPLVVLVLGVWPRFAWAVAVLAVLGVAVWLVVPGPAGRRQAFLLAKNESVSEAAPAKQLSPPLPAAPATASAPPTTVAQGEPARVALAETAQLAPRAPAYEPSVEGHPPPKNAFPAQASGREGEKLALATSSQLADRKKAAEVEAATSGGTAVPASGGTASLARELRYGAAAQPSAPAAVQAGPPASAPMAAASAAVTTIAADESANRTADKSGASGFAYKSVTEATFADRLTPSSAATASLGKSMAEEQGQNKGLATAQRYFRITPGTKMKLGPSEQAKPAQPVLASFQVEQAGRVLRVIDEDGSVYTGYWQMAAPARRARAVTTEAPAPALASRAPQGALEDKGAASLDSDHVALQAYSFRVTGTNRSLHQKVVFAGNLLAATNLTVGLPITNHWNVGGSLGAFQSAPTQPGSVPLLNSRISGKVMIGKGKAFEINALPVGP